MMPRLQDPWWLALIPLLLLIAGWRWSRRGRRHGTVTYSSLDALHHLPKTLAQRFKSILPWLQILGLLALIIAMARPQAGREDLTLTTHGLAIQLVIDRSGSMEASDLDTDRWDRRRVTRLDVVKEVVKDFVDEGGELPGRPDDMVGLVSFAGFVQAHCPLTLDHELLLNLLDQVEIPPKPHTKEDQELRETALGDAIVIGVDRLSETSAQGKVMVLLSDGASNVGVATPDAGARAAEAAGVKIYTVGIGSRRQSLDTDTLEKVAKITGGESFLAQSASEIADIYRRIDGLERTEIEAFRATRWRDLFPYFLMIGLGLLVLHRVLADTRFRSLP